MTALLACNRNDWQRAKLMERAHLLLLLLLCADSSGAKVHPYYNRE
jgi:hypothetical protein